MQLPPAQVTRAVIQRYARVLHRYSAELGKRPLVLPTAEFFPDTFTGDAESTALLALRMQEHAGLEDVPIECRLVAPGAPLPEAKSCSSGACGVPQTAGSGVARLVENGDSWILQVPVAELQHPVALTTNLARSLAFVFLVETQREGELLEPPVDVTADLVAVALGFGTIMLQGSYIYAKSCGGPQVASVTKVGVSELAICVALFAELGGHKLSAALKSLDVTQRASLAEAHRLVRANRRVVERLGREPGLLARNSFVLDEPGDFFGAVRRKFGSKPALANGMPELDPNMAIEELESLFIDMPPSSRAGRAAQSKPAAPADELKRLVADALSESRP
jgi:hypothetical protein